MTPAALEFKAQVIQVIRERMLSPRYQLMRQATTLRGDSAAPRNMFKRDMMILGAVLLPDGAADDQGVIPAHHLDDADVRTLIQTEVNISPRNFLHTHDVGEWDAKIPLDGQRGASTALGRRFYTVGTDTGLGGLGAVLVPTQAEKDAEGSTIDADAVVLPDLLDVTDAMRYTAIGA